MEYFKYSKRAMALMENGKYYETYDLNESWAGANVEATSSE